MHITKRLASRTYDNTDDVKMFKGFKADIEQQALLTARAQVKHEIDSHAEVIAKHEALVAAANAKAEAAEAKLKTVEGRFAGQEKDIASRDRALATVKSSWTATKDKLASNSSEYQDEMKAERSDSEKLKVQIALLEGRISEIQNVKPIKTAPVKIPPFDFQPKEYFADGRIKTLRATPVGMN